MNFVLVEVEPGTEFPDMSSHERYMVAIEKGAKEEDFYQRKCSVCGGIGRWGEQLGPSCFIDYSCDSCEGTGYQLCRKPKAKA
jgi:DnaJ-class molecular chaperone